MERERKQRFPSAPIAERWCRGPGARLGCTGARLYRGSAVPLPRGRSGAERGSPGRCGQPGEGGPCGR